MTSGTRSPQRERALQAMTELAASEGYAQSTVAQIVKVARISRTTFYEHFKDREECFLAAQLQLAEELAAAIEQACAETPPDEVWPTVLETMIEFAAEHPEGARVLTHEALGAGPRAQSQREDLMSAIERTIETSWERSTPTATLDTPACALVAAALRLLSVRLRDPTSNLDTLQQELLTWSRCYTQSSPSAHWQSLTPDPTLTPGAPAAPALEPSHPPARGPRRLSDEQVSRNQRQRIMHAAASVSSEIGMQDCTVADIVKAAKLPRDVFYEHFADKRAAFLALNELVLQSAIGVTAAAFIGAHDWPERVWASGRALTSFISNYPTYSRFGLIDANALGPDTIEQIDHTLNAFTIFLEEGYRSYPKARELPEVTSQAIAAAIHEIATRLVRHNRAEQMAGTLPLLSYIVLTPFIGPPGANELIDQRLREETHAAGSATAKVR